MAGSRRRWGWHQLTDDFADHLVATASLPRRSLVLDIGAGLGALTLPLAEAGHRVVAIEAHPGRAAELERTVGGLARVVRADASDLRLPRQPFHVVANLPFAITSPVLRRLLHRGSLLETAHLVVQEAAARRWVGADAPGWRRWVATYEASLGEFVPRGAFMPPPRVAARLLVIVRRERG